MSKLPDAVRKTIRERVWTAAAAMDWEALSPREKVRQYEHWTAEPDVGGVLVRYMDRAKVRGYIKDSVMKPFARARKSDTVRPLRALRVAEGTPVATEWERPHGLALTDGRVVCWGRAEEWKHVIMALHERTFGAVARKPYGAVLTAAAGQFQEATTRDLVENAATKLGVERVVWLDT
jgi:hypothetical protein